MITRKTFVAVAATVSKLPSFTDRRQQAKTFADMFSAENPRFDRFRFFAACNAVSDGPALVAHTQS
jgi:hypothetical protein